ncbi:CCR4-NOT transcription complex subunit 3-like [Salvia splendens]|uniref:CCR4-NOT transcription complex subunit 3-like n=1 Tax=Salvia splendens TaxID=180675 RepID=UPI001C254FB0|nr:CCR4-NOT transcription complex subunit 3-like [Salvia splendens]
MASPPQPPSPTGKSVAASDPLPTGAAATSGPLHVAASDPLPTGAAATSGPLPVPASDPLSEGSGNQLASGHGSNQGPLSGEGSNERQLSDQGSQVVAGEGQASNEEVAAEELSSWIPSHNSPPEATAPSLHKLTKSLQY